VIDDGKIVAEFEYKKGEAPETPKGWRIKNE